MRLENRASTEVVNHYLAEIYKQLGEYENHDEVVWGTLTQNERLVFCRLAGCPDQTCNKTASKTLANINADMRNNLIVAIKRMGSIAKQFNSLAPARYIRAENPPKETAEVTA